METADARWATGMNRHYYVYMMTNAWNTVIYVGVTYVFVRRVCEDIEILVDGFTSK